MRNTNNFDLLRLLAALSIVVAHAVDHFNVQFLWVTRDTPFCIYDGVPIFFMISGYLVFMSCEKCIDQGRPLFQYYINRFLRIAPGLYIYLMVTVIGLLAIGTLKISDLLSPSIWAWVSSNLFLIPVYYPQELRDFGVGVLNGSLWTIPAEFSFYLILPIIVLGMRRINGQLVFVVLALLSVFGVFLHDDLYSTENVIGKLVLVTFIPYILYFSLGIFWYKFWGKVSHHPLIFVLCAAWYFLLRSGKFLESLGPIHTILWAIPLSYLVMWIAFCGGKLSQRLINKVGDLSYGVYIWHMVAINFLMHFKVMSVWIVLLCTLGLAFLSWWFVENPALSLKSYTTRKVDDDMKRLSPAYIMYVWHRIWRRVYKRPGALQSAKFEHHHRAMKYHKSRLSS